MPDRQNLAASFNCRIKICTLGAIAMLLLNSSVASAATYFWNVASGDWSTAANWQTGIQPTHSDAAWIQNGGKATITQIGETCYSLFLGTTNTGTVDITGGSLSAEYNEYVGYSGTGTITQTGGTNSINDVLCLGYNPGSIGTYNLNGGMLITSSITKGSGTATFNFGGGTLQASGTFTSSLPMTLTGNGGNANVDTAGCAVTLSRVLSGTGGLNKLGSGTLTLSAANTYSGITTISQGTLALHDTGSIGSSSLIDVQSGATFSFTITSGLSLGSVQTLEGAGTVKGSIVADAGSHIKPGDGIGTLTFFAGNLTLNSGAVLDFDLATTAASDKISITGVVAAYTLFLNGQQFSDFNFTALDGFGAGTYTLIDAGKISGNLGANLSGTVGGLLASMSKSGNDLILTVAPEPDTLFLLASALAGLLFYARQRGK